MFRTAFSHRLSAKLHKVKSPPPSVFMSSSRLVQSDAYVNGKWIESSSAAKFDVLNPVTGQLISQVPNLDVNDARYAVESASNAFKTWSLTSAKERSGLLRKWFNKIKENSEDIAQIISSESGKPLVEAVGEVNYGNSFLEWFSEEARRIHGEVLSSPVTSRELIHLKQPVGVAALITPWNFPLAMITRKAGAALAAGCTCVIKPAEDTPLTALALAALAEQAGIPPGVINVVPCDRNNAPAIGKLFCEHPQVPVITFTGSTAVGKILYRQCAPGIKRLALELGGNAPFIVFKSADIKKAVLGATASKFRNAGQACVSSNRFLIQEDVFEEFVSALSQHVKQNITFDCQDSEKQPIGPLINPAQLQKVEAIVNDALTKGATVHLGGRKAPQVGQLFYEPTILSNIATSMSCYREEIFGPVIPCIKFSDEAEAVSIANESRSGLAGYFYSSDISQIFRVAKQLEVGMVGVNEGIISTAEAAFGGIKESGLGREGSHYGLDEFLYIKYVCLGGL